MGHRQGNKHNMVLDAFPPITPDKIGPVKLIRVGGWVCGDSHFLMQKFAVPPGKWCWNRAGHGTDRKDDHEDPWYDHHAAKKYIWVKTHTALGVEPEPMK